MLISALGAVSFASDDAATDTYPKYGPELALNYGMEEGAVGVRDTASWDVHYDANHAFFEYVHKDTVGEDWVYEGNKALRYTNILGQSRPLVEALESFKNGNEKIIFGETYEVSAYFKTSSPTNVNFWISIGDAETGATRNVDLNTNIATDDGWVKASGLFVPGMLPHISPTDKDSNLRIGVSPGAIASDPVGKVAEYVTSHETGVSNWTQMRDAIEAENTAALAGEPGAYPTHYLYVDNFSLRRVTYLEILDLEINKSGNTKNDAAFVTYTYGGADTEGTTTITWEKAAAADATEWETVKTVTTNEAEAKEDSFLALTDLGGSFVRVSTTTTDTKGRTSMPAVSEPFFVENTSDIMTNGGFYQNANGWTGAEYNSGENNGEDETGSILIASSASTTFDYPIASTTILGSAFDLKGTAGTTVTVEVAGTEKTFTMNGNWISCEILATVESATDITVTIEGTDVLVDNISIKPRVPLAQNVLIDGTPMAGQTINVGYTYNAENIGGEAEGETVIKWYAAESESAAGIEIGTGLALTLLDEHNGKFVYAGITPVSESGVSGTETFSSRVQCFSLSVSGLSFSVKGGLKTTGFLVPTYTYNGTFEEVGSKLEWVMADDPDAPIEFWEKIDSPNAYFYSEDGVPGAANYRRSPLATVTEAKVETEGYLALNHDTRGKYVAFKITPCDEMGNEGTPVLSPATEAPIEFVRNMINNGDFELGSGFGHDFTLASSSVRETNSPLGEAGDYAMAIDGEGKKSAVDEAGKGGTPQYNQGDDLFQLYTGGLFTPGDTYTVTADVKLDYEEQDVTQTTSFLLQYAGGYNYTMNSANSKEWTTISLAFSPAYPGWYAIFSFRAFGNASDSRIKGAGKWLIDNFGLYTNVPWVTNINIKGNARVGSTLTASYDFNKVTEVGSEFESPYKWLKSDYPWGPWEVIEEGVTTAADKPSLAVTSDLENKYIRFSVSPREDTIDGLGLEMQSTTKLLVAPSDTITVGTLSGDTTAEGNEISTTVDFTNKQGVDRDISTVIAVYQTVNGAEKLTAITKETKSVATGETVSFEPVLTVNEASVDGTARVFVLEGSSFDKLIPLQWVENPGAAKASLDDNRAFADNDKDTAQIISKTNNEDVLYSVVIVKDGVDPETATFADIVYFGQGISNAEDGSYQHTFSIDGAADGQAFDAVITYDGGLQNKAIDFTYYGAVAASAIGTAVDAANVAQIEAWLEGTLIDDTYDMVEILAINTSDYDALTERGQDMVIAAVLEGKNYTGNLGRIREIVEAQAKDRFEDETWMKKVDESITAIKDASVNTLPEVFEEYNDLYDFDLDNEYGFAINLNSENKETFMNLVKTNVLAAQNLVLNTNEFSSVHDVAEFEANTNAMKAAFAETVALQAVNLGAWEDMSLILAAQNAELGIDLAGTYATLSANQKNSLHQAIFADTFTSIADFQTRFPGLVTAATAIKDPIPEIPGAGGGGGGGGAAGGTPTPSFGGDFADSSNTNESAGNNTAAGNFKDVKNSHWAAEYIEECSKMGIIKGYEDGSFAPEASITRAEFLAIMIRTLGITSEDEVELTFADVPQNEWFFDVVKTATAKGIVMGSSATEFNPNNKISREEMAVMTYRTMNAANLPLEVYNKRQGQTFADAESISSFATESINNLSGLGIINGMGDGTFAPKQAVTRAMAAKIAYELLKIS